jgi:vitamin B12 transporter
MLRNKSSARTICFRHWSRKGFSVLVSLNKVIKIGVLCMSYSLVNKLPVAMAQSDTGTVRMNTLELEEVEITGRRNQAVFSEVSRTITVISRGDIEKAGVQNIVDLLEFVANVDIRQRGLNGVQADASIRGGSFDHVMVLVNGVNLSDPQTGHFSLDLPIDYEAIEKVEILEGPATRVLGPGAFTGAVNIITRNGNNNSLSASQTTGMYGYKRDQFNVGLNTGSFNSFLSASRNSSTGFTKNTDFNINNLYYRGNLQKDITTIDFQGGYQRKRFGAGGFYSPRFPDQYEETDGWFASLKASTGAALKVTSMVYWRRKKDHFLLVRSNPAFYENFHLTDVYGSQLNISYSAKNLTTALGFDIRSENILSNNIGFDNPNPKPVKGEDSAFYTKQYGRVNFACFQENTLRLGKAIFTAGAMINWNTGFHGKPGIFPGLDISYSLYKGLTVYTSINRALHLPTFTDLFYTDPVNHGNIELEPNRMMSYEGGIKRISNGTNFGLAGFYHSGQDMIDWLWSYNSNRFSPINLDSYKAWGISSNFMMDVAKRFPQVKWLKSISINYMYLDIAKSIPDSVVVSKYYSLRHKLSLGISHPVFKKIVFSWNISYQDRYGETIGYKQDEGKYFVVPYKPFWLIDGAVKWNIRFLQLYLEMSNILNTRYIDAGSALQPGRWLKAGLVVRFL